jgi:hypothetical protein
LLEAAQQSIDQNGRAISLQRPLVLEQLAMGSTAA